MSIFKFKTTISPILIGLTKIRFPVRCVSTAETLEPINMSYATYESTSNQDQSTPFIVIHGLFGSKSNWNSMCKAYNQKCKPSRKIIAVDVRNHGESPHTESHTYAHIAADLKALLDQLSISRAVIMGHSMGGRASMLFALKYPELVDRLIVADISPVRDSPHLFTMPSIFQTLERINLPTDVPMSTCRTMVDDQLSKSIEDKGLRAFLLTNLVEKRKGNFHWRINIPTLLSNFNHLAKFPILNDSIQYKGPTLFVAGANSDFIKKSDLPKIQKLFPSAELKFIEGAGHWLHSEKPAEFMGITLDFLNRKIDASHVKNESKTNL